MHVLLHFRELAAAQADRGSPAFNVPDTVAVKATKATPGANAASSDQQLEPLDLGKFCRFADFPSEIQDAIWKEACHQPVVLQILFRDFDVKTVGKIPLVPGVLHATRGSRNVALKHFEPMCAKDFDGLPYPIGSRGPAVRPLPVRRRRRREFIVHARIPSPPPPSVDRLALGDLNRGDIHSINIPAIFGEDGLPEGGNVINNAVHGSTPGISSGQVVFPFRHPHPLMGKLQWLKKWKDGNGGASSPKKNLPSAHHMTLARGAFPIQASNSREDVDAQFDLAPGRKIFINMSATIFKLQVDHGLDGYAYPTFSLAPNHLEAAAQRKLDDSEVESSRAEFIKRYKPPLIGIALQVPGYFDGIQHLVLNLALPPVTSEDESYPAWAGKTAGDLMTSEWMRGILARLPSLKTLRFYVVGDHHIPVFRTMAVRDIFADAPLRRTTSDANHDIPVRESDGITFDKSMLRVLEHEIQRVAVAQAREGNKKELLVKLCAWMPEVDRHDKDFYRKLVTEGVDRSEAKSRSRQGTANGLAEALEKGSVPA